MPTEIVAELVRPRSAGGPLRGRRGRCVNPDPDPNPNPKPNPNRIFRAFSDQSAYYHRPGRSPNSSGENGQVDGQGACGNLQSRFRVLQLLH